MTPLTGRNLEGHQAHTGGTVLLMADRAEKKAKEGGQIEERIDVNHANTLITRSCQYKGGVGSEVGRSLHSYEVVNTCRCTQRETEEVERSSKMTQDNVTYKGWERNVSVAGSLSL